MTRITDTRKNLKALRLVNVSLCRSATPWLFQHIDVRCSSSETVSSLTRLLRISKGPLSLLVRQIDIGFHSDMNLCSFANSANSLYIEDLFGSLSFSLMKCCNLAALEFHETPEWLEQKHRNKYMDAVASILRYVPLSKLQELQLKFPVTHDYGRFFPAKSSPVQIPIQKYMKRLRYLGLYVCQYTDHQDENRGRYWASPVLPEYVSVPNSEYATLMLQMVEMAPNLESLSINSLNILNIDLLTFPSSLSLRSLDLTGVSFSCDQILKILDQSDDRIRYINFSCVYLNSGTWRYILLRMCHLRHLLDINIDFGGYSLSGTSSSLAIKLFPHPERPRNIETDDYRDLDALGNLQRKVNLNRIALGLRPFPDTDYKHINKSPLESSYS